MQSLKQPPATLNLCPEKTQKALEGFVFLVAVTSGFLVACYIHIGQCRGGDVFRILSGGGFEFRVESLLSPTCLPYAKPWLVGKSTAQSLILIFRPLYSFLLQKVCFYLNPI